MRRTTTATAVLAAVAAVALVPVQSSAAAPYRGANTTAVQDDFDGDGYRDIAYQGAPGLGVLGGAVTITYGGPGGLDTSHTQTIHQNSPGVPGVNEEDDQFGVSMASADLNKDGYADLVVGNPSEHVGEYEYRGSLIILWGSSSGLSGGKTLPVKNVSNSHYGNDVATGDFNGDGSPDVAAVGGGDTWLYRGAFTKSGDRGTISRIDKEGGGWYSSTLAAGRVTGDGKTDLVITGVQAYGTEWKVRAWFLKGTSGGLSSGASKTLAIGPDAFGINAVIGDFDKDGYGDIAIGEPDESSGKGAVNIWYGASSGPSGTRSAKFTQSSSGIAGTPEAEDNFAYALSAADSNGDGYADLAVGIPHEDVRGMEDQGAVHVLRGGSGGLSGSRSILVPQTVGGTAARDYESFGHSLRLRDVDADGRADLAIAAATADRLLPGSPTGPTAEGSYPLPGVDGSFVD